MSDPLSLDVRYSRTAIWLHWIIALLLVANLLLGLYHEDFGKPAEAWLMFFHKSIGMSVLALTIVRLLWRVTHRPPAFDPAMRRWEIGMATLIHWLFYLLLIAIPLSGWLLSSTSNRVTNYFGLFEIGPLPISRDRDVHEAFEEIHEILGKVMIGLIVLHVAGALKHHFEGHRHLIGRMAPWVYRRP
jgi:cytochrome b561